MGSLGLLGLMGESEAGWEGCIVPGIFIIVVVVWPLIQRMREAAAKAEDQKRGQPGGQPGGQGSPERTTGRGYEAIIGQLLGVEPTPVQPSAVSRLWDDDDRVPKVRPPEPPIRILEVLPEVREARPGDRGKTQSLEDRIFGRRDLSVGAKMILASEILRRPGSPRR